MNSINQLLKKKKAQIRNHCRKHFNFHNPIDMTKKIHETKNADENKDFVNLIKNGLVVSETESEEMPENEIGNEKLYEIVDIVDKILYYNDENQEEQGLGILTPNQMLSRIQFSLAQLKAGNSSEKIKNEMRNYCILCIVQSFY